MDSGDARKRLQRIVVNGPLAAFADGLRGELAGHGYALDTVCDHVHVRADLSGWLGDQDLTAADLTTQKVEEFLQYSRRRGYRIGLSPRAIAPILGYLRSLRAAPPPVPPVPVTPQRCRWSATGTTCQASAGCQPETVTHHLRVGTGLADQSLSYLRTGRAVDAVLEQSWLLGHVE